MREREREREKEGILSRALFFSAWHLCMHHYVCAYLRERERERERERKREREREREEKIYPRCSFSVLCTCVCMIVRA